MSDDWDTDPDFVNTLSERERRTVGSKHLSGSQKDFVAAKVSLASFGESAMEEDRQTREKASKEGDRFSRGYGGEFGLEKQTDPQAQSNVKEVVKK
eukprot:EC716099.1.p1 GENE.EC716099.1~~EC716099.1.p1  ORF type:complete len:96 (+),score=10.95 EC716099.1:26-313(+)